MTMPDATAPASLGSYLPAEPAPAEPEAILDQFVAWASARKLTLYPAQEEALLEVMAGRHVVLETPTGSGKSLVALGVHFKALWEGRRSYYTSPIKALASEKFFQLCDDLGADRVGMMTGDASINPDAPVICCTAEVLANLALRRGAGLDAPYAVLDEFHYYGDPDRGWAWQVPLIALPRTTFLLMSATLGDTSRLEEALAKRSGRAVAAVRSADRPVPLDYEYREAMVHETVQGLSGEGRLPAYVVSFTQRECAELAQSLTSLVLVTKPERERLAEAVAGFRFDSPYGRELKRLIRFGVGVHHAGLLPKYRLLVEQLSQQALLKVICGTDTLGVGVNVPIRTVLFTKLAKFDGKKTRIMRVRDFKQIAGRAGRKGFDDKGSVICLAPEHVVERKKLERKAAAAGQKRSKAAALKVPEGFVGWDQATFTKLIERPPEPLKSRFQITQGIVLDLVARDAAENDPSKRNLAALRELIANCHEDDAGKKLWLHEAALRVRSLHRAGILRLTRDVVSDYRWVSVSGELQREFSLHQALSLYFVEAVEGLDVDAPGHELRLLSLAEAILEDPRVVVEKQVDRVKGDLVARLKAEGVPYEERMDRLDEVHPPNPEAELLDATFETFCGRHPWAAAELVRGKSVAREMYETFVGFSDYVRQLGIQRAEGVLLRYLSQLYKTLQQNVPQWRKTDAVLDAIGFFRAILERVDTSLLEEWESLRHPDLALLRGGARHEHHLALQLQELLEDEKAFRSRVRAEMHLLVKALAGGDLEEAAACIRSAPDDPEGPWTAERFEAALAPFVAAHGRLVFDASARLADKTQLVRDGDRVWKVIQVLVDPEGENLWYAEGRVSLRDPSVLEGPLVELRRIAGP